MLHFLMTAIFFLFVSNPGMAVVTYEDVKPILDKKCVPCHSSSLDLRNFPFKSDFFPTQEDLVKEMIRRFRLQTWQRMPPPRVTPDPLTPEQIRLFENWMANGLLRKFSAPQ